MAFPAILAGIKTAADGVMSGVSKMEDSGTRRVGTLRGWAGPIVFLLTALPFVALLWGWFSSAFFKEASYVSENVIKIIQAIGPVYFFSVISILLTGTAGATALTVNRGISADLEKSKEEQKTIQLAIEKGEAGKLKGFDLAFSVTLAHEGGYANDPDDRGGETYKGIARVHHPKWSGWRIIDKEKGTNKSKFPECLKGNQKLDEEVKSYYKEHFWQKYKADRVCELSELLAVELFDSCVNSGSHGVRFLQEALNDVAKSRGLKALKVDGVLGEVTFATLDALLPKYGDQIYKLANHYQAKHYTTICENDESQYKYLMGWLKRV
jgi:lysozyme family protein